jgi:2-amino-4-hydroxy-6-hydroxymethyldihydropteridine diphosphokinase
LELKLNAATQPDPENNLVYLSLGSNIEPETNLPIAVERLLEYFRVLKVSCAWQNPPIGTSGPDFLNAVVLVKTALPSDKVKFKILRTIESHLGRVRTQDKNAPRTIDIDILLYNDQLLEEELWERAHLAVPLAEIYPDYQHPNTNQNLVEIAKHLQQTTTIICRADILTDL